MDASTNTPNVQQPQQQIIPPTIAGIATACGLMGFDTVATPTGINATVSSGGLTSPNIVKVPVPVIPPPEDIYTYVAVKGSLHAADCAIFGLNEAEKAALAKRFTNPSTEIVNGVLIKCSPMEVINALGKLAYKVICSTGEAEIVWTLQREV